MNPNTLVLLPLLASGPFQLQARETPSVHLPPGYGLSWQDEFNGAALNMKNWGYRQCGPRHDAVNTPEAVSVTGGQLVIRTYTGEGKHCTGMIATRKEVLDRPYGFYEASISCSGDERTSSGMWSAFWLQSDSISSIGNTGKYGTEIDIVEYRPHPRDGKEINQALHYHGYGANHRSAAKVHDTGLMKGFHTYGVLWTAAGYAFYMDGKEVWTTPEALSCIPEYIILSSEIRDKNWAGNIPGEGYGDKDAGVTAMKVDYVRVYSLPHSCRTATEGAWSDRKWMTTMPSGKGNVRNTVENGANVWITGKDAVRLTLDRNAAVDSLTLKNGTSFHLRGTDRAIAVKNGIAAVGKADLVFDTQMSLEGKNVVWTLFEEGSSLSVHGRVTGKGNLFLRTGSNQGNSAFLFHAPAILKGNLDAEGALTVGPSAHLEVSGKTVLRKNSRLNVRLDGKPPMTGLAAAGGLELQKDVSLTPEFLYEPEPGETIVLVSGLPGPVQGTFRNLPEGKEFTSGNVRLAIHYTDTGILLSVLAVDKNHEAFTGNERDALLPSRKKQP